MKNFYAAVFFLLYSFSGTSLYGQENLSIESLYAQRRSQAQAGQDYAPTERTILSTGIYPTALVTTSVSEAGKSFDFTTYKEISADKQDRIEQRLIVSISGIQSVEINNQHVAVNFSNETTEENILLFFKLLGYTNYELK